MKKIKLFLIGILILTLSLTLSIVATGNHDCAAGQHRFNVTVREPTATTDGERVYTCVLCGYSITRILFATQCVWGSWITEREPTCIFPGQQFRICTATTNHHRETRVIAALGHDFEETVTAPTCTADGVRTYTCRRCGQSGIQPLEALRHDEQVTITEPTCTAAGIRTYTCRRCNRSRTQTFGEATGHSYIEEITTPPTYYEEGVMTFTCEYCGDSYTETIPMLEAPEIDTPVIPPLRAPVHVCNFIVQREIQPCCEREGYIIHACTGCDRSYTKTIYATGHDFSEWVTVVAPTRFSDGLRHMVCSNPAQCIIEEVIPRLFTLELNYVDAVMAPVNIGFIALFSLLLFSDLSVIIWDLRKRLKDKKAKKLKKRCVLFAAAMFLLITLVPLFLIAVLPNITFMNLMAFTIILLILPVGIVLRHFSHNRRRDLNGSRGVYQPGEQKGLLVSKNRV